MKKLLALVLALVLMLSLAACGDKSNNESTVKEPESTNDTTKENNTDDTTLVIENDEALVSNFVAEKVVVQTTDPTTLAPFGSIATIMKGVYQTLGGANKFGGELKGILMESWERIDAKTYEVKLYDNIVDTNGNQITTSDVKFSIDTIKEKGELSDVNDIEDIEIIDDLTFRMILAGDEPALGTFELMCCFLNIVDEDSYNASPDGMATTPVGSGPYKVENYVTSSEVVMTINEDYWESEEIRDLAVELQNVKTIDYKILTESSQIAMALQSGTIDLSDDVNAQDLASFKAGGAYSSGNGVYTLPSNNASVLCFNASEDSPLNDYNLRMAVMWAIDSDLVAASVNGGNTSVAYCLGGPNFPDYNEAWADLYPGYDLEKAKDYMSKSEYADGLTLKLIYISGNSSIEDAAVVIQQSLASIGVNLEIEGQILGQYLANEHDSTQWDFTVCNFTGNGYITNVWRKYFDGNSTGTGLTKNFVEDEKLQELISTASSESGHNQEAVDAVWEYVMENGWMYALFIPNNNIVYNSDLIESFGFDSNNGFVPGGCVYVQK